MDIGKTSIRCGLWLMNKGLYQLGKMCMRMAHGKKDSEFYDKVVEEIKERHLNERVDQELDAFFADIDRSTDRSNLPRGKPRGF